jgi:type II secretory pathway component PulF
VTFSAALRALADLCGSGLPLRRALARWYECVSGPLQEPLRDVAARIRLGAEVEAGLAPLRHEPDARALSVLLSVAAPTGASTSLMLRTLADSIDHRDRRAGEARAAAAAARASNRMLAALPLVVLPLLAASGSPVTDGLGVGLAACGAALALAATRWVEALIPAAPTYDQATTTAELAATMLRAGSDVNRALDTLARAGGHGPLVTVRAWVRLGKSWPESLMSFPDDGLVALGRLLERCRRTGLPAAVELERFAAQRRARCEVAFERATRAAPVRMVVPLVLCGLPAFCLTVVAPMLRSIAIA